MELKPGYKLTEVGVIPEDWEVKSVFQIAPLQRGFDLPTTQIKPGAFPVVYSNGIENFHSVAMVKGPGVVTGRSGTLGKVHYIESDYWPHNTSLWVTRFNGNNPKFIYYLYESLNFERFSSGSGVPTLNRNDVHSHRVPIPPTHAEQRAIAQALSDVDALLAAQEQLIAKKRDLKQAAMQQLLTGKTRLPGFSGEWEVKSVKEFGEVVTGGTPCTENKELWGEGYPWITPTDISTDRDITTSERTITHKGLGSIRALPAGSVLVTCIASIGKNVILRTIGGCNQQINAIIPNNDNCAEFIYYLMEASKQYLLSNAGVTATAILSKFAFSDMKFFVPMKPEQTAIAAVLSDMDAEISALEVRCDKTRSLKHAMMQELLTGKTRLV